MMMPAEAIMEYPAYLHAASAGALAAKAEAAREVLRACRLCPRACRADRFAGPRRGYCQIGRLAHVASWGPHHGEEACLSGRRGSGTIFFSRCNLGCVFCQNSDISQASPGNEVEAEALAAIMLDLQDRGCHNINLVTPSHVVPQIIEAVGIAAAKGLRLPLVYNTGGYDSLASLALLDGLVDIYMPDFKAWNPNLANRLLSARNYPGAARRAIREMHRQVGPLEVDRDGIARRGVLVRHLVMPGLIEDSRAIFEFLARDVSPDTYVNILAQYHPAHRSSLYPAVDRPVLMGEVQAARDAAAAAGLHRFDGAAF